MSDRATAERDALPPRAVAWGWLLAGLLLAAAPFLLHMGRDHSFYLDEFDFIINRDLASPSSLMTPWNGHWVALPAAAWRVLLEIFGIRTYLPYQVLAVAGHLAVVATVWMVARRLGARGWIATATVAPLVLLGSGRHNILFGFQVALTAALALGLGQLLLATHDGGWNRRDTLGLVLGTAALMSSGLGVATALGVGVATFVHRGWRIAVAHVLPLALLFVTWWVTAPAEPGDPDLSPELGTAAIRFASDMGKGALGGLGGSEAAAVLIAVLAALGSAHVLLGPDRRRERVAVLLGVMATGAAFLIATSTVRSAQDRSISADSPRYVHILVALVLPVVAVGIEHVGRRSRWLAGAALLVLATGLPANVRALDDDQLPNAIAALARSESLPLADPDRPLHQILPIPVALLQDAASNPGEWSDVEVTPAEALRADVLLTLGQQQAPAPDASCRVVPTATLRTSPDDTIRFTGSVVVTALDGDLRSEPVPFDAEFGDALVPSRELRVAIEGLHSGAGYLDC